MKIKIGMENFTGNFGGVNFKNSVADVESLPPRLKRICGIVGYELTEVTEKPIDDKPKPRRRTRRKKAE